MIPNIWHSRKSRTIETVKRSVTARSLEGRREERIGAHRGLLGQCNCFVQYKQLMHDIIHLSKAIQCKTQRLNLS